MSRLGAYSENNGRKMKNIIERAGNLILDLSSQVDRVNCALNGAALYESLRRKLSEHSGFDQSDRLDMLSKTHLSLAQIIAASNSRQYDAEPVRKILEELKRFSP